MFNIIKKKWLLVFDDDVKICFYVLDRRWAIETDSLELFFE